MDFLMLSKTKKAIDKLNGKKIYCFGDSLMTSKYAIDNNLSNDKGWIGGYPKSIQDNHQLATIYNYGSPNAGLCSSTVEVLRSLGQSADKIFDVVKSKLENCTEQVDYIILNGCGNDIYVAGMMGKNLINDLFGTSCETIPTTASDDNTICGALEIMFEWLIAKFPMAKIIYISLPPIKQFHSVPTLYNNEIEKTLLDCTKEVCIKYGVTFIDVCNTILRRDLFSDSGFFYQSDVHMTNEGYSAVAGLIDSYL